MPPPPLLPAPRPLCFYPELSLFQALSLPQEPHLLHPEAGLAHKPPCEPRKGPVRRLPAESHA